MELDSTIRGFGEAKTDGVCAARVNRITQGASIRGVVLAGGPSYGDCELEQVMPRPMLPIATRPLICHILSWFGQDGVGRATVCANGNTALFSRHLRNGEGLKVSIDYTEDLMPRGPAGCAHDAARDGGEDLFVVVEGGVVPHVDLAVLLEHHRNDNAAMTMVVRSGAALGNMPCDDDAPLGIYVFNREALSNVSKTGFCDIKEGLISDLYKRGENVSVHRVSEAAPPRITCRSSYLVVNSWAVEQLAKTRSEFKDHFRRGDAWVHKSANVSDSAQLVGPIWVGQDATVGDEAMIVGPVSIGAEANIGAKAVVTRSAIWDRGVVSEHAIVDGSIVASGAVVPEQEVHRSAFCKPKSQQRRGLLGWFPNRRR